MEPAEVILGGVELSAVQTSAGRPKGTMHKTICIQTCNMIREMAMGTAVITLVAIPELDPIRRDGAGLRWLIERSISLRAGAIKCGMA